MAELKIKTQNTSTTNILLDATAESLTVFSGANRKFHTHGGGGV